MVLQLKKTELIPIVGDASFRQFFRKSVKKNGRVIVICKKDKYKNLIVYSAINNFLRKNKILAPKLLKHNYKNGIIEIQDFGNASYYEILSKKKEKLKIYKRLVNLLLKIQKIKIKRKIKTILSENYILKYYNVKCLHNESDLFLDWYLPMVAKSKNISIIRFKIKKQLDQLYKRINLKNNVFVHRDFHVSNLMKFKNNIGILDSQDALIGNPAYDLVSLIDDVRIVTPNKLKNKIYNYYLKKGLKTFNFNRKEFLEDFNILSIQRSLKIIGIFSRLYQRDGKSKYLKLIPYTWKILENRCKNKMFKSLRLILDNSISKKTRKKLNIYAN